MRYLSPRSTAILAAVVAALRPRGHGFDQPIDGDVLAEIDRTIPCWPGTLRLLFPAGLRLLEWGAVLVSGRPLSRLRRDEAERYLAACLRGRLAPLRALVLALRTLILVAFYEHPEVLRAAGIDRERRLEEALRLRARLLAAEKGSP